ncbi:MAG: glycosyltransferase family A protein, partial [Chloroflexota bacterium]|nr:glycosyltransferase family A protein [Chloroflexota bacterium]
MNPSTPEVSILLPCYNAADTLFQSLDSLISQTLQDFEIVAVDDGSTDNTLDILQHHASLDNRICTIQTPHRGIVSALNTGLAACRAPYVARMDSDDRAHPKRLEKQVSLLDDNPQIGVVSCLVSAFPKERVREGFLVYLDWLNSLIEDQDIRREIFIESPLPHPSVTF